MVATSYQYLPPTPSGIVSWPATSAAPRNVQLAGAAGAAPPQRTAGVASVDTYQGPQTIVVLPPLSDRTPEAPFGRDAVTGLPLSDKSKVAAGVLNICLPCGVGRMYAGDFGLGVAQLVTSVVGIGVAWSILDGVYMLVAQSKDGHGRLLRPSL